MEFPGFVHFHNWNGGMTDKQTYKMNDGSTVSDAMMKDLCGTDSQCDSFVSSVSRVLDRDVTYDLYLATNQTLISAAICSFDEQPGCNTPKTPWMTCKND